MGFSIIQMLESGSPPDGAHRERYGRVVGGELARARVHIIQLKLAMRAHVHGE